jgi:hypothetical protein
MRIKLLITLALTLALSVSPVLGQQKPSLRQQEQRALAELERKLAKENKFSRLAELAPKRRGDSIVCKNGFIRSAWHLVGYGNSLLIPKYELTTSGRTAFEFAAKLEKYSDQSYRAEGEYTVTRAYVFRNNASLNDLRMLNYRGFFVDEYRGLGNYTAMLIPEAEIKTRAIAYSVSIERSESELKFNLKEKSGAEGTLALFSTKNPNRMDSLGEWLKATISIDDEELTTAGGFGLHDTFACMDDRVQARFFSDNFKKYVTDQYGEEKAIYPYAFLLITDIPFSK